MTRGLGVAVLVSIAAMLSAANAQGHDGRHDHASTGPSVTSTNETTKLRLRDHDVVDQDGKPRKIAEILTGKVAVVDFVFTSCTTICPMASALIAELQDGLRGRLGREIALVSISVDPATDTPRRLRDYGQRFGAKPGWTFVTGRKQQIELLLRDFRVYTAAPQDHVPLVLVGDAERGIWTRHYGLPQPVEMLARIDALIAEGEVSARAMERRP